MRIAACRIPVLIVTMAIVTAWPWSLALWMIESAQESAAESALAVGGTTPVRVQLPKTGRTGKSSDSGRTSPSLVLDEADEEDGDDGPEMLILCFGHQFSLPADLSTFRLLDACSHNPPPTQASRQIPLRC